jgi:hypothetical protein
MPSLTQADGGTLRFTRQSGGLQVSLFTSPPSPRAGLVDFSVLVQAADTRAPLLDVPVTIHVYPVNDPARRLGGSATTAAATNKLFQAIQLELAEPGLWHVEVEVNPPSGTMRMETDLEIGEPLPSWLDLGLWIGWPAAAIGLFIAHQLLVRRS